MADNPTTTARVAGETATMVPAAKDRGGVLYQRVEGVAPAVAVNQGSQVTVDDGAGGDVILAANADRMGFSLIPSGDIYLSFGGTPTSSTFLLPAFTPFNMLQGVIYTGAITGLAPTASAVTVYVVEF